MKAICSEISGGVVWHNPRTVLPATLQSLLKKEVGQQLTAEKAPAQWLKLIERVGAEDRSLLRIFAGHATWVNSVAFSPDGRLLLIGSADKTARIWQTSSGSLLTTLQAHAGWVNSVAFSPDGKLLLTGSTDETAHLWETGGGAPLPTLQGTELE